jgi:sugar phosphate isomerase/epimerase
MHRRRFITSCLAAGLATISRAATPALSRFKLGAISDGFSQDFEEALKMMASCGLHWVEIREVFGVYNTEASAAQIQQINDLLDKYKFRVSVIDSALYKCALPGTMPAKSQKDNYPYADQMELLKRACDRAHSLGAEKIRGFTFWRVAEPRELSQRIAAELGRAAETAQSAGMRLVIENEESCNAATGRELSQILALAPAPNLGANWDVGNGYWQGEASFPAGYQALDKKRIWHMHLKGVACGTNFKGCSETIAGQGQNDLIGQFRQLVRDGYQGTMSLECEFHSPGLSHAETTQRSLQGVLRAMNTALSA